MSTSQKLKLDITCLLLYSDLEQLRVIGFKNTITYIRADKTLLQFASASDENRVETFQLKDILQRKVKLKVTIDDYMKTHDGVDQVRVLHRDYHDNAWQREHTPTEMLKSNATATTTTLTHSRTNAHTPRMHRWPIEKMQCFRSDEHI